jgi:hypothetical protein
MFQRVSKLGQASATIRFRPRTTWLLQARRPLAVLAGALLAGSAHAQTPPSEPQPPGNVPAPYAEPGTGGPSNYPPASYGQPGYPQQPGYPPNQQQTGGPLPPQGPMYGQPQPPGYGGIGEPPLPPAPKRKELQWSIRFNLLDLLFGRATGAVEYAFAGPFSFALVPEYIFADPRQSKSDGVTASGAGVAGELGYWVEGRPLRGYFLKAHGGYRSVKFKGPLEEVSVPSTEIGAMFGSQSIYGGWFTLNGGIGVVYDLQSKDRPIATGYDSAGRRVGYIIPAPGLFGNGFDLLGHLAIGGSF